MLFVFVRLLFAVQRGRSMGTEATKRSVAVRVVFASTSGGDLFENQQAGVSAVFSQKGIHTSKLRE
jgi:hypothetical protein